MTEKSETTKFISQATPVVKTVLQLLSNAHSKIDGVGNQDTPSLIVKVKPYWNALAAIMQSNANEDPAIRSRYITDITQQNLKACKKLINELHFDLRHLEGVRSNILISEKEIAIDLSPPHPMSPATRLLYSNSKELLEQQTQLFETLWSKATPAHQRVREIEEGRLRYETRILHDSYEILQETARMVRTSNQYSVSSVPGGLLYAYDHAFDQFKTVLDSCKRGDHEGIRWLTTIDGSFIDIVKKFLDLGMVIRHVNRVPTESFGFSEKEVGVTVSRLERGTLNSSALFSNDPMYVEHYALVFEEIWTNGIDARQRIREIEEGIEEPNMMMLRNRKEIQSIFLQLINQAKDEVLLILPTTNSYARNVKIGVIKALQTAASDRGVKVSILAPGTDAKDEIQRFNLAQGVKAERDTRRNPIYHKSIPQAITQNAVIVLVVDRNRSLIVELEDDSQLDFSKDIGVATYSTRGSTVKANVRFFERMWEEEILLDRERRSRREAELLQDILAHDLRNYNQISKTSAELLKSAGENNLSRTERAMLLNNILKAVNRSSDLIERAKKLGRIVSQEQFDLHPVNLEDMLRKSVEVVMKAHPERNIEPVYTMRPGARVLADDFLEEAFTNILSNSVKYTEKAGVRIEIGVEEESLSKGKEQAQEECWRVTIIDEGKGIPDQMKGKIFTRYLDSAHGSGLGLSIVYALVVERYSGKVKVRDRVKGNHKRGTVIEVFLPAAI